MRKLIFISLLMAFIFLSSVYAATISGTVVDKSNGNTLPSVNIFVKGARAGTMGRDDGSFEIRDVPNGEYTLVFSIIGFKQLEKSIQVSGDTSAGAIELEPESIPQSDMEVGANRIPIKDVFKIEPWVSVEVDTPMVFYSSWKNTPDLNKLESGQPAIEFFTIDVPGLKKLDDEGQETGEDCRKETRFAEEVWIICKSSTPINTVAKLILKPAGGEDKILQRDIFVKQFSESVASISASVLSADERVYPDRWKYCFDRFFH